MAKRLRIRRVGGKRHPQLVLTVPVDVGRLLNPEQDYVAELVPEGLLYRAVSQDSDRPPLPVDEHGFVVFNK